MKSFYWGLGAYLFFDELYFTAVLDGHEEEIFFLELVVHSYGNFPSRSFSVSTMAHNFSVGL